MTKPRTTSWCGLVTVITSNTNNIENKYNPHTRFLFLEHVKHIVFYRRLMRESQPRRSSYFWVSRTRRAPPSTPPPPPLSYLPPLRHPWYSTQMCPVLWAVSSKSQIMKLLVSLKKIWHLLNFNKSFFVIGKTEEVQTFSFETGDDEKYELIEGSHTFQSEVQSIRT